MTLKPGNVLKKGSWGFYNQPTQDLGSVYENFTTTDLSMNSQQTLERTQQMAAEARQRLNSTTANISSFAENTRIREEERIKKIRDAYEKRKQKAERFGSVGKKILLSGEQKSGSDYATDAANIKSEIRGNYKKDIQELNENIDKVKEGESFEKVDASFDVLKNIYNIFKHTLDLMDTSSHPNLIDYIGNRIGEGYYKIVGISDGLVEDKNHYKGFVLSVLYAFFSVILAYFATENWFYFFVYEFTKKSYSDDAKKVPSEENNVANFFQYAKKTSELLFFLFSHIFFPVVATSKMANYIRGKIKNNSGTYFSLVWVLKMVIFFIVFNIFQYWTTISNSGYYNICIYVLAGFYGLHNIYETFKESASENWILFIIKVFIVAIVLFTILFFFFPLTKLLIYFYFLYISFFTIIVQEGKLNIFTVLNELYDYYDLLFDHSILKNKDNKVMSLWYNICKFSNSNWFVYCLTLTVFGFLLICLSYNSTIAQHITSFAIITLAGLVLLLALRIRIYMNTKINETTVYKEKENIIPTLLKNPKEGIRQMYNPPKEIMEISPMPETPVKKP